MILQKPSASTLIIGVDEVGRGCLAGPVVAAAVYFKSNKDIQFYKDSKTIKEIDRQTLSESIHFHHVAALGWASVEEVDAVNILQATFLAMRRAVLALPAGAKTASLYIDGPHIIPKFDLYLQIAVIKGDQKLKQISAASLVAKVARDEFMKKLAREYPEYGFEQHKGYGTFHHREQIQKMGPCPWHRKTFAGVKEHITSFK